MLYTQYFDRMKTKSKQSIEHCEAKPDYGHAHTASELESLVDAAGLSIWEHICDNAVKSGSSQHPKSLQRKEGACSRGHLCCLHHSFTKPWPARWIHVWTYVWMYAQSPELPEHRFYNHNASSAHCKAKMKSLPLPQTVFLKANAKCKWQYQPAAKLKLHGRHGHSIRTGLMLNISDTCTSAGIIQA